MGRQPIDKRGERLNRLLRDEISILISRSVRDPRVQDVHITGVSTNKDLHSAKVYYTTTLKDDQSKAEIAKGLVKASGFIRSHLGKTLHIRRVPELIFLFDSSMEYGEHIEGILRNLKSGEGDEQT